MRLLSTVGLIIIFFFSIENTLFSQHLNQTDKGGFYLYWGYNRSAYTKSSLRLVGPGYDFRLNELKAEDRPEKVSLVYLNPKKITIPQFNVRMGYFFMDKWAVTFGYDHMKYIMRHPQTVKIKGHVDPGVSTLWNGDYNNQETELPYNQIHYENSDGNNYIRFGVARYFDLLSVGEKNWFRIRGVVEGTVGFLLPFNDLDFGGKKNLKTISVSGYGISLHPGLRLEFFNHLFFEGHFSGGFLHHVRVRTRPDDKSSFARQAYGFIETDFVFGYTWRFNRKKYDALKTGNKEDGAFFII